MTGGLEFGVLGPLRVRGDAVGSLRANKQRALLASLLVDADRVVTVDELIRRVWGVDSPAGARNALQNHILRLRHALAALGCPAPVLTQPEGYQIQVPGEALDLSCFTRLMDEAKTVLYEDDDAGRASALLDQALSLWRGEPLSDVPSEVLRREVVPVLTELRLTALEHRAEAHLRLGRHHEMTAELQDLTARHPLRERFWAQRMLALYRSGRAADALDCYHLVRGQLAQELGIEPSPDLRRLHQAVLTCDASLGAPAVTERVTTGPRARRNDLPADIPGFIGRTGELRSLPITLHAGESPAQVVVINGMAGVGKTALAVHAAHRVAGRCPDAQLFLDMRGDSGDGQPTDSTAALGTLLRALAVPDARIPDSLLERSALWRAELAERRVLLVLDNVSAAAQIRPLLPGMPGCQVLVTSRHRLADLDATCVLSLDMLPPEDAHAMFSQIVGTDRVTGSRATADVMRLCGYLPLAIRIAAGRLRARPAWTVDHLAGKLRDERERLAELTVGDRSVAEALAASYRQLPCDRQRLFRLLGLIPALSFDIELAAMVVGIEPTSAERALEDLLDVHLLEQTDPGWYRFHVLARCLARAIAEQVEPGPVRQVAAARTRAYQCATQLSS